MQLFINNKFNDIENIKNIVFTLAEKLIIIFIYIII